ncbi:hypothetical protein ACVIW2_009207 [Bradyrhizobium huanghuaihaiense]|jgi:hypothetical protein|uniref:Uncharacterized protein n=1 Tax=Bradyrhizobium barranii subsp. barranii TaxID=2823807 RepID=A0A7Z0QMV9_9BRAD|nr:MULTISPECIES: hypothetical protein [Bradyrhizobium]UGX89487.1 hypothetical protein G6321_00000250 [Bradyrhizobium barranii subsp. barranii]UQE03737.1 hypothetical protein JEY30_50090 [Bradyrhizobium japonicum]WLB05091.1 hypothetical protein QNJ80_45325 [Bradyrhizobium elkanii]WLB24661.1 hypothetical protein QIH95_51230 [Bradyrhizobium japonicum]GLR95661.1 hypothetical protein GCM10007858_32970 [Bradyrhizobium liaoningense]
MALISLRVSDECSVDLGLIRAFGTEPFNFTAETEHAPFQRGIAREWASQLEPVR